MNEPFVHKVFTGKVKRLGDPDAKDAFDREWETGMFKEAVDNQIWLTKTGLKGDEVADTKNHGGPEKALFAYPVGHYAFWKEELNNDSIEMGSMGENLAVLEMDEFSVCIGDTYQFGDAVIQVSQPRRPCWKPARRLRVIDFALRTQESGKTGWYFRVLKEGLIISGIDLELLERPYPEWTIAACNEIMYFRKDDLRAASELASCPLLAENWRRTLKNRLLGRESIIDKRVFGPNRH
ncbi:MOSC domain-containing protein YiiM [Cerasibacillus quisquiliarum]|uniref:Molybdenum cofactor sulfurase n=1 Tax=Cerasibacillus quisquiliarum TaxID=227865 RepID=A0A511UUC7_9BACI|nr:MOSC domain-containing protein [Cerasibacillus quisquiliarum]MBB5144931.1 MOSC domain-containing protein YiiM [Cerasibacillus quisquiliarum]GEN30174.1 molybdenum cofactor sulfurase [Cerasibacillus quisquiliarum]